MITQTHGFLLVLAASGGSVLGQTVVASDDFDAPLNLIGYSAADAEGNDPTNTGVWSSPRDNFGPRSMRDRLNGSPSGNFLSETLVDASTSEDIFDTIGILTPDYEGRFFAICDTDNGVNPSGVVEGTWTFDVSGAGELGMFSVDIAAVGNWFDDGEGLFERFVFAYSIDGGPETTLLMIRGDASAGPVTYALDSGFQFTVPADTASGPDDNGATIDGVVILNELTTVSAPMSGSGDVLTVTLNGFINDNNAGVVFDNMVIESAAGGCNAADIAEPFGVLDLADTDLFISSFIAGDAAADLATPFGVLDLADTDLFITSFLGGCP